MTSKKQKNQIRFAYSNWILGVSTGKTTHAMLLLRCS